MRLKRKLGEVNYLELPCAPLFVTLTFGRSYPTDAAELRQIWDRFARTVRRKFPVGSGIYRKELQERGAPHVHLILFGVRFWAIEDIEAAWAAAAGPAYAPDLQNAVDIERVDDYEETAAYVDKYLAKDADCVVVAELGRPWGVINRRNLPIHIQSVKVTPAEYLRITRAMREHLPPIRPGAWQPGAWDGCWLMLKPEAVDELLWPICRRPLLVRDLATDRYTLLRYGPYRTMTVEQLLAATRSTLAALEGRSSAELAW